MTLMEPWRPQAISLDTNRPFFEQFADMIRSAIAKGELQAGQRLIAVREFASLFRVNPNTVMRTYADLEREGFLQTFRGQGTFVTKDPSVLVKSKKMLAHVAYEKWEETAKSLGMTIEQIIEIARKENEEGEKL